MHRTLLCALMISAVACSATNEKADPQPIEKIVFETVGSVTVSQDGIIDPNEKVEKLGGDYGWSEGPVWVEKLNAVLFTDVPGNTIWKYKDGEGLTEYMKSSPGANGLIMLDEDHIIVPDHGNRTLWAQNIETKKRRVLADNFEGKKLNSPNDAALHSSGIIYFTDPPYGLKGQDSNPAMELDFSGVFALYPDGSMKIIDKSIVRPNGVILSPDERTLYVANSDPATANWKAYDVSETGDISNPRVIAEGQKMARSSRRVREVFGSCHLRVKSSASFQQDHPLRM